MAKRSSPRRVMCYKPPEKMDARTRLHGLANALTVALGSAQEAVAWASSFNGDLLAKCDEIVRVAKIAVERLEAIRKERSDAGEK